MNRTELIKAVAEHSGWSEDDAKRAVNAVFESLATVFSQDEPATISGFGKFTPCVQQESKRINPRTGASIIVPERRTVRFKASPILKEQLNGNPPI